MNLEVPTTILLKDYRPTAYIVETVSIDVRLHATATLVTTRLTLKARTPDRTLALHGEGLVLVHVRIDGEELPTDAYTVSESYLTIHKPPQRKFILEIAQLCNPQGNTQLSGLYLTNGVYCTQMEAEGFRRFAYFYDRPDVMATYRVRVEAPKAIAVLLSNGNCIEAGDVPGTDNHYAIWDDPHPKPSYLFALVGGDLAGVHDEFVTMSRRKVALGIYVEKGKEDRCGWAMESLKASMLWDEKRFGREYDLDVFNIVAVSDFNMGAMENKGLNVFNDKYVLARPDTAIDMDYLNIEAIIGHEYFHNWTGNRVTCRDWFQLCLKEGLTVFRDQEFTSDLRSRAVKRIQDVKTLRARQFPEDQGPLAHPARPSSYIEINNFYTPTVYEKGAEICRMIHTLIGETVFRKAMDLYFERHDGEAATVEDFVRCMADASGRDLGQFFTWYEQAGTPKVNVSTKHDAALQTFDVEITQETPATPGQIEKKPLHMPLSIGLVGEDGIDLPLHLEAVGALNAPIIEVTQASQVFRFTGVKKRAVLSINRGYSAPIALHTDATEADLLFLMGTDSDNFNRWEAMQTLARALLVDAVRLGFKPSRVAAFAEGLQRTLVNGALDDAFKSSMLILPPEAEIAASLGGDANSDTVWRVREAMRTAIGARLKSHLLDVLHRTRDDGPYQPDPAGTARRNLRYASLSLLAACDATTALSIARIEIDSASSMSAEYGALVSIAGIDDPARDQLLDAFYRRHGADHLLIDKWFVLQATIPGPESYLRIQSLLTHPDFKLTTPNRVYAALGGFTGGNLSGFNAVHGEGYRVVADTVIALNSINPQVGARLATGFRSWQVFEPARREKAKIHMQRILETKDLSRDIFEIVSKTLNV